MRPEEDSPEPADAEADAARELALEDVAEGDGDLARDSELGAGAWSYFGDPRAISHHGHTFTGWISTTGNVWIAHIRPDGSFTKRLIYRDLGVDDHNNPSLVFRPDGRIMVFFSPHSGHFLPPHGRVSKMRYRITRYPYSIRAIEPVRHVLTNVPGGLGFTYPNPIQQRGVLWLFWRGGGWNPTFSYTRDGRTWVAARELLRSEDPQRPYAKYVGDGNRRIHGIFTEGHANHFNNSLYYLRYERSALFAAGGRRLGSLSSVPLPISRLERVYRFTDAGGSAWPHDIALTAAGRPRIVYTRRVGNRDTFYYAYHNGSRWVSHKIVAAGPGFPSFTSGGATLDHEDPRSVYLSRRTGAFHQVEAWVTPDNGRTWRSRQLTAEPAHYCIRPVSPRGLAGANLILFSRGDRRTHGFTDFLTRIHALAGAAPPV
ncbi:MAG: BNR repeat-containing protein [Actinomycetota bacterium]|nr:BNR repeat-containing protein [Actinomycetota bacterium]